MSNAVLRSPTGTTFPTPARLRRARRSPAAFVAGEALEDRRLLALVVTPVPAGASATTLGAALLVPNTGLTITGGTYVGAADQGGTYTGFDLTSSFGENLKILDGVLLTTGLAANALPPNNAPNTGASLGTAGDPDLDVLLNTTTLDANALTLNFTADPGTQSIMFDFIFGTEQYTEFIGAFRNDAFSAYLDGTQITFDGNGDPPSLDNVSVDNLANQFLIEYDGLTPHVRTRAPLNNLLTSHTLKFVIADGDLGDFDSGVFLARLQGSAVAATAPVSQIPTPGALAFSAAALSVAEAGGVATVTVNRTGGTMGLVTVDYATTPGTATDPADFTGVSGTIVFADGQASQTFTVPIIDDPLTEGDETINLVLSNAVDATLGAPAAATLTILDDERAVQFIPNTYTVDEATGTITLTVARSGPLTGTVTVDYATADGLVPGAIAQAPSDYLSRSGTLTFADGQQTATITVPIIPDFLDLEPTEMFTVTLTNPVGTPDPTGLGGQPVATVSITNVERPPSIYDITAFAPDGRIEALYLQVNEQLRPEKALDPANYGLFQHKESKQFNSDKARKRVAIRGIDYNAAVNTITIRPTSPLKKNVFYEVDVRGTTPTGVTGSNNEPLDGNFDRFAGDDFVGYFGRGTRLQYRDDDGDQVMLGAKGGGLIEVFRDITRNARTVRYLDAAPPSSAVFGKIKSPKSGTNKTTTITNLLLGGAESHLPSPPFQTTYVI